MDAKVIEKWRCPQCLRLHDEQWDAQGCCPQRARRAYICSECDGEFDSERECINDIHCHKLQKGEPSLGEWETAQKTEVVAAEG